MLKQVSLSIDLQHNSYIMQPLLGKDEKLGGAIFFKYINSEVRVKYVKIEIFTGTKISLYFSKAVNFIMK